MCVTPTHDTVAVRLMATSCRLFNVDVTSPGGAPRSTRYALSSRPCSPPAAAPLSETPAPHPLHPLHPWREGCQRRRLSGCRAGRPDGTAGRWRHDGAASTSMGGASPSQATASGPNCRWQGWGDPSGRARRRSPSRCAAAHKSWAASRRTGGGCPRPGGATRAPWLRTEVARHVVTSSAAARHFAPTRPGAPPRLPPRLPLRVAAAPPAAAGRGTAAGEGASPEPFPAAGPARSTDRPCCAACCGVTCCCAACSGATSVSAALCAASANAASAVASCGCARCAHPSGRGSRRGGS